MKNEGTKRRQIKIQSRSVKVGTYAECRDDDADNFLFGSDFGDIGKEDDNVILSKGGDASKIEEVAPSHDRTRDEAHPFISCAIRVSNDRSQKQKAT